MSLASRLRSPGGAFAHDVLMIPLAWFCAYWIRFNLGPIPEYMLVKAMAMVPILIVVQGVVFWYVGLYRGVWRFASIPDLVRIVQALVVGIALSVLAIFIVNRMQGIPPSVFPLYGLLLLSFLGGPRLLYRWLREHHLYAPGQKKVLVVGAGQAGEMLVRELLRDRRHGYHPLAFVDDDARKQGREIHGVRVAGPCERIPDLVTERGVEFILLAVPTASARDLRRIVELCERTPAPFRMLPRIQDLVGSRSAASELREVAIEDLLGREPVSLDWASISRGVAGKVILVSGGGGSIGAELCRQICQLNPRRLVVLDNSEFNLYSIEMELGESFPRLDIDLRLADICDTEGIGQLVATVQPDMVFHAAAYKHVPMLESQAREAARNNVLGTRNLALAAAANDTRTFVLISTDKAVNPTNVMGATKRVAEILCQNMDQQSTATSFITVRFGNVLDSAGSVVPLFRRQIRAGGPVTVTHPEIKRYFMTIPEACQLIMEAAAIGSGGEVFVLDMGEPIKISYLAEQMIVLAGKRPGEDVEIVFTGLRPGEKLYEELFHEQENLTPTGMEKLLLARYRRVEWQSFSDSVDRLAAACARYDEAGVRHLLEQLVPEFAAGPPAKTGQVIALETAKR